MNTWLDAARRYSALDEAGRAEYWQRLTPEQRIALTQALSEHQAPAAPAFVPVQPAARYVQPTVEAPAGGGFFRRMTIGCGGFVLGVILTIALQLFLVLAGVQAAKNFINDAIYGGQSPYPDCGAPRNAEEREYCAREEYLESKEHERRLQESLGGR